MASVKIGYMSQENNMIPPYLQDQNMRASSGAKSLWNTAPPATPQTSNASMTSVWGSPLSVLPSAATQTAPGVPAKIVPAFRSHSGIVKPDPGHQSLAALAADSEPVLAGATGMPGFAPSLSSASSRLSSRQNSQTDISSPGNASISVGSAAPTSPNMASVKSGSGGSNGFANDEIINTAIVVKNIPFAIKKEQLIDFMTQLGLPLPYAFNYHFDNGVFRGLAFANFTTADETAVVISSLNGRELGGRKLRVEYKKMLPFQERERIEREKRERRGQLEEQHQQASQSKAHTPTPSGQSQQQAQSQVAGVGLFSEPGSAGQQHSHQHLQPHSHPHVHQQVSAVAAQQAQQAQHAQQHGQQQQPVPPAFSLSRSPSSTGGSPLASHQAPSSNVDMNDPEVLQTYSSLLIFKRDVTRAEICIPPPQASQLTRSELNMIKVLTRRLDLACQLTAEHGIVISRRVDANNMFKSDADVDGDLYFAGIFKNALVTPAASYALPRMGAPNLTPANTNLSAMSGMNRWNSVSNLASLGGSNIGAGASSLVPK